MTDAGRVDHVTAPPARKGRHALAGGASGQATRWVALIDGWYPRSSLYSQNSRPSHWGAKRRLLNDAAERTGMAMLAGHWPFTGLSGRTWIVTLTVLQQRGRKPDGDNLQGSLKHCRDRVAKWLGVDDGSDAVEWRYGWERGRDGVLLELEEVA